MIIYEYNVSNDNNPVNNLQLGKKGPNTQMCFYTNSYHRECTPHTVCLPTIGLKNRLPPQSYNLLDTRFGR